MWPIKKNKKPSQRHISEFGELDRGGAFSGKIILTKMQIKPKILQGRKPEMTYITGMKNTINPKKFHSTSIFVLCKIKIFQMIFQRKN